MKKYAQTKYSYLTCYNAGFIGQHAATGKAPLAALGEHLSNPVSLCFTCTCGS
jgi:hypothetical protein